MPINIALIFFFCLTRLASANTNFRALFFPILEKSIPAILAAQNHKTGRWGHGPIVVTDQNAIYPLAVAWSQKYPGNKFFHDPKLLSAILRGGDFLISQQKSDGEWVFRTHDGGEWGDIYMPWTYSRWIRTYGLIAGALPPDERTRWQIALTLGFTGIAKSKLHGDLHFIENIPTHHAMALYIASQLFHRPDWKQKAIAYLHAAIKAQNPGGFWTENLGPVVNYNFVYMDTLGTYYAISHDPAVLPALTRAAAFHANFTYPDGRKVETIDERNAYDPEIEIPNVGFTFSPLGRAYIFQQLHLRELLHQSAGPDLAASMILYAQDGPTEPTPADTDHQFILGHNDAVVLRQKPWFICLSAYHTPIPQDRWIQDRQNFLSIYHDGTGLIIGGGNTKLTPLWSTFTAGDTDLLQHKIPTTNPSYLEPPGLLHVPDDLKLIPDKLTLLATYAGAKCKLTVNIQDANHLRITVSLLNHSDLPIAAHITLVPNPKAKWTSHSAKDSLEVHCTAIPDEFNPHSLSSWTLDAPLDCTAKYPVYAYDQYVKNGKAPPSMARMVITIPLGHNPTTQTLHLDIGE